MGEGDTGLAQTCVIFYFLVVPSDFPLRASISSPIKQKTRITHNIIVANTSPTFSLTQPCGVRLHYYAHFADEEVKAQRSSHTTGMWQSRLEPTCWAPKSCSLLTLCSPICHPWLSPQPASPRSMPLSPENFTQCFQPRLIISLCSPQ